LSLRGRIEGVRPDSDDPTDALQHHRSCRRGRERPDEPDETQAATMCTTTGSSKIPEVVPPG
jgi:hypothetical protein